MAKKVTPIKKPQTGLGNAAMVYTRASTSWVGLVQPEIVTIEATKFLQGTQVTGKVGHRLEGKRTLIPLDYIASIIEFQSEEDLWSEPQPKHIAPNIEEKQYTPLTSHSHTEDKPHGGDRPHRHNRHFRNNNRKNHGGFRDRQGFNRGRGED